jgi:hypothetical protein
MFIFNHKNYLTNGNNKTLSMRHASMVFDDSKRPTLQLKNIDDLSMTNIK